MLFLFAQRKRWGGVLGIVACGPPGLLLLLALSLRQIVFLEETQCETQLPKAAHPREHSLVRSVSSVL